MGNEDIVEDFTRRHEQTIKMNEYQDIWTTAAYANDDLANMQLLNEIGEIIDSENDCFISLSEGDYDN